MEPAPRRRVLFVDDDAALLASYAALFRRERSRWDMVFAHGGAAALAELAAGGRFDVVVSDLQMPGVNGIDVMREVTARHPGTVRILLSGGFDDDSVAEASWVADHLFEKPCDRATLRAVIDPDPA